MITYTVMARHDDQEIFCFIEVQATNAVSATKKAEKVYRKNWLNLTGHQVPSNNIVYMDYIFEGKVKLVQA